MLFVLSIRRYLLGIALLAAGCQASQKTMLQQTSDTSSGFDSQGHRGARGLAPENTWPAFKAALDAGVRTLELDVVISRDKRVLISHDPFFQHDISSHPDGRPVTAAEELRLNIYRMDYAEISRYDVGSRKHPRFPEQIPEKQSKPLLSGLIDEVANYMRSSRRPLPYFNIEIKSDPAGDNLFHPEPAEFCELVIELLSKKDIKGRYNIQSFDFRPLQYLHKKYPEVPLALLIEGGDKRDLKKQISDLGFTPAYYSPAFERVTPELITGVHALGMKIIPWTVNTREQIAELKAAGVDGIISDYPNYF